MINPLPIEQSQLNLYSPKSFRREASFDVMNLRRKNIIFFIVLACLAIAAYASVMIKVAQSPVM